MCCGCAAAVGGLLVSVDLALILLFVGVRDLADLVSPNRCGW